MRFALLYGASAEGGGVRVDAFYEPPQRCMSKRDRRDDDDDAAAEAARAAAVAASLGLRVVGVAFAHDGIRAARSKADAAQPRRGARGGGAVDADADAADTFVVVKFRPLARRHGPRRRRRPPRCTSSPSSAPNLGGEGRAARRKKPAAYSAGASREAEAGLALKSGAPSCRTSPRSTGRSVVHDMTQPYTSPLRGGRRRPHANRGFTVRKLHLKKSCRARATPPIQD